MAHLITRIGISLGALAFVACFSPTEADGKGGGETCSSNDECRSGCCYPSTQIAPFCSSTHEKCMGGSSSSSSSGGSSSGGTSSGTAYVEFVLDSGKYQSGSGLYVTQIVADGRSFVPEPIAKGTGSCTQKIVLQGAPLPNASNPKDLFVQYTIYVRNYGSLDAAMNGQEYSNEEYKSGFRVSDLEPGCNTLEVSQNSVNRLTLVMKP